MTLSIVSDVMLRCDDYDSNLTLLPDHASRQDVEVRDPSTMTIMVPGRKSPEGCI
jgi:hypothetical protein